MGVSIGSPCHAYSNLIRLRIMETISSYHKKFFKWKMYWKKVGIVGRNLSQHYHLGQGTKLYFLPTFPLWTSSLAGQRCLFIVSLCMAGRIQSLKSSLGHISSDPESVDIVSVSRSQFPIHRRQVPNDLTGYGLGARVSLQLMR